MNALLVKGGKVALPSGIASVDILVDSATGKISRIGHYISMTGAKAVDASGLLVLPGAIDCHVHFREPESTLSEDFSTGSASALAGGVTTIIDMPCYRNPATNTIAAYNAKRHIAHRKCRCDWQVRFGASEKNQREAAKSGAPSLKLFLARTGSELDCSHAAAALHFSEFPKSRPICVHAEDSDRIAIRKAKYSAHHKIRDKKAAWIACEWALRKASASGRRIHLCHLTTAREVDMCRKHRNATYEINPAHLYLCERDLADLGFLGNINPPLRDRAEQARLWRKIGADTIIASDHAPHMPKAKREGASGFPGVGTLLPLMLQAAHARKIPLALLPKICAQNPAAAFSLAHKGAIAEGKDADLVLVDMGKKWRISAKNRISRCGWTPFEGKEVYGKIEAVYLRGQLAYDGKRVLAKMGFGKEVH